MKIALYGGSFDPIHIGHLITASCALDFYNLEKVIFIPSHITPLKERILNASDKDRAKMVSLSIESNRKFELSDYEIRNSAISYSFNTVKYFKEFYPDDKLYFIIGTDRVKDLKKWYNIIELSKMVTFIFVARDEESLRNIIENDDFYKSISYEIMPSPIIEISSSLIRDNIKNNKNVDYMITKECKNYIEELSLYGFSRNSK
ncbi:MULTISPECIES: nicotinate (nicotinamide) nucleotide adenylyltransferase [Gemella]|uniref:nicotinate (nicotinamide) nucleotide adenylyltransferase n=1 Tax=Gemella TaxID=1378 RepID=UPI0007681C7A|nr:MULTISPECIES: nicotinate (nicotinamide) nucleotide adenylyltransferase [Gemella]AME09940.1 nicotinate-nicotinamide nucleotide adenylyltransferase [Gemella sp. oral taxon 928]